MPGAVWYLFWPLLGGIGVTLLLVSQPLGSAAAHARGVAATDGRTGT